MTRSASTNFADASVNMLPQLKKLPPGWKWVGAPCGGNYHIVEDPDHVGERAPRPR